MVMVAFIELFWRMCSLTLLRKFRCWKPLWVFMIICKCIGCEKWVLRFAFAFHPFVVGKEKLREEDYLLTDQHNKKRFLGYLVFVNNKPHKVHSSDSQKNLNFQNLFVSFTFQSKLTYLYYNQICIYLYIQNIYFLILFTLGKIYGEYQVHFILLVFGILKQLLKL